MIKRIPNAILFAILLAVVFLWFNSKQPLAMLPAVELMPAQSNRTAAKSCIGMPKCVLVYMAPWCPACRGSIESIKRLIVHYQGSDRVGVNAIIGSDQADRLESMAAEIGSSTFIDEDGSFASAAHVSSIPKWLVIDGSRKVLREEQGGLEGNASVADYKRFLDLE